ncbi:30S ribosomal protein S18, partial [Candidatus Nomurabacteria bacterium RIFCSPLOWO2_02_FULL_41_9]
MKQDYFSANNIKYIDYKDIEILKKFLNSSGKIMNRKRTGVTSKNQRALASAVKHARFLG